MTVHATETLPRFTPDQLGPVAADMAVLVGQALQANRVETITDLSFVVSAEGTHTDASGQKVVLDGFGEEHLTHFVFEAPGANSRVSTSVESHPFRGGWQNVTRQRLILNDAGSTVQISEQTNDGRNYQPVSTQSADKHAILSMAEQARGAEATGIEEATTPLGNGSGFNEILVDRVGFVPVLGRLLVAAGSIAPNLTHEEGRVHVDIYADCSTSRGLYNTNTVRIWGVNHEAGSEAVFMVKARPFLGSPHHRFVFASVALRTIVRHGSDRTATLNKLIQHRNEVKRVSQVETGTNERELLPANFDTVASMAEFVTKVAQGKTTSYE